MKTKLHGHLVLTLLGAMILPIVLTACGSSDSSTETNLVSDQNTTTDTSSENGSDTEQNTNTETETNTSNDNNSGSNEVAHTLAITSAPLTLVIQGRSYEYQLSVSDSDPSTSLTYELREGPAGMTVSDTTGLVSWNPADSVGEHTVTLVVTNAAATLADEQTFSLTVEHTLEITSVPPEQVIQGESYEYQLAVVDSDSNANLTYELREGPTGMTVSDTTGLVSWNPADSVGEHTVTLVVTNAAATLADEQTFSFTVVEHTLEITSAPPEQVIQGESYEYQLTVADSDPSASLTYELREGPTGMTVSDTTGLVSWDPADSVGEHTVTLVVTNAAAALTDEQVFSLAVGHTLEITSVPFELVIQGQLYEYQLTVADSDPNASLTYELREDPAGMTVNDTTGLVSWIPVDADVGKHNVKFAVTRTNNVPVTKEQEFSLTVLSSAYASQLLNVGDVSGNTKAEIGLLELNVARPTLTLRELNSGTDSGTVSFANQDSNQDLTGYYGMVIPDLNSNGADEVALFGKRIVDNELVAEVRDMNSGDLLLAYEFGTSFDFVAAGVVPDITDDSLPELAVLAYDASTPKVKVDIIDLTKVIAGSPKSERLVSQFFLDRSSIPVAIAVMPDIQGNDSADELAVLMQNPDTKAVKAVIIDAEANFTQGDIPIQTLTFGVGGTAESLEIVNDLNNNGTPEVAVLGRNYNEGTFRYRLRDALTNELVVRPWFPGTVAALDAINIGDISGDGIEDIATLALDLDTDTVRVMSNSAIDGTPVSEMSFGNEFSPRDVIVLPDMNGNNLNELAFLGVRLADGKQQVTIMDAFTRELIQTLDY